MVPISHIIVVSNQIECLYGKDSHGSVGIVGASSFQGHSFLFQVLIGVVHNIL